MTGAQSSAPNPFATAAGTQAIIGGAQNALGQVGANYNPYAQAGQQAVGQYSNMLMNPQAQTAALTQTPGYQFALSQGQQGINNAAAAGGTFMSGNTPEALAAFNQGLASTTFNQYMSQLAGLSNMGLAAVGQETGFQVPLMTGIGQAQAQGIAGMSQGFANMFGNQNPYSSVQGGNPYGNMPQYGMGGDVASYGGYLAQPPQYGMSGPAIPLDAYGSTLT